MDGGYCAAWPRPPCCPRCSHLLRFLQQNEFIAWWRSKDTAEQEAHSGGIDLKLSKIAAKGRNEILEAKIERQEAERDVQLLMNRLQHLK